MFLLRFLHILKYRLKRQDICAKPVKVDNMNRTILTAFIAIMTIGNSYAQLKTTDACPTFTVDVLEGNINRVHPKSTIGEILKTFPCQSAIEERQDSSGRCSGVFYTSKQVNFYTGRNYIEIKEG